MGLSVTNAIGAALNRAGRMLFKPFELRKWFVLGFCAWLSVHALLLASLPPADRARVADLPR